MTGIVLHHGEPNGPSLAVLAALEESGLDVECFAMDILSGDRDLMLADGMAEGGPHGTDALLNAYGVSDPVAAIYSVEGEGPVMVVDGEAMCDSVFLAQYLDEMAGGCGLQPADPYARWQMRMWVRQATERLAPAAAYVGNIAFSHDVLARWDEAQFAAFLTSIASEDLRARWQDLRDGKVDEGKLADSRAKVAQFTQRVEDRLADGRDWLMGDFSIADLETFAWLRSMRTLEAEAFSGKEACNAWMDRVESRPSVQAALARSTAGHPETAFAPGPEINRWG